MDAAAIDPAERLEELLRQIERDIDDARRELKSANGPLIATADEKASFAELLLVATRHYKARLRALARTSVGTDAAWNDAREVLILPEARLCAAARALVRKRQKGNGQIDKTGRFPISALYEIADELSDIERPARGRRLYWKSKPKGGFRLMQHFRPADLGRQILIRDWLTICDVDSPFDFSRPGSGGESAFREFICQHMAGDHQWWTGIDIKQFYNSLRAGHLVWLPVSRTILKNVIFNHVSKHDLISKPPKACINDAAAGSGDKVQVHSSSLYGREATQKQARKVLPEGSALSPLVARAFLGRVLQSVIEKNGFADTIAVASWSDDLPIGATTRKELMRFLDCLRQALNKHPFGPIFFPAATVVHRHHRPELLGLKFWPGRGRLQHGIHVKPGQKRLERHRAKLTAKHHDEWHDLPPGQLEEAVSEYADRWYRSQPGWTKVPHYSKEACITAALVFVCDLVVSDASAKKQAQATSLFTAMKHTKNLTPHPDSSPC